MGDTTDSHMKVEASNYTPASAHVVFFTYIKFIQVFLQDVNSYMDIWFQSPFQGSIFRIQRNF